MLTLTGAVSASAGMALSAAAVTSAEARMILSDCFMVAFPKSRRTCHLVAEIVPRQQRFRAMILQICRTPESRTGLEPRPMYDWNDLRCFLAVAREGSTLAGARVLRTSQTTVARRIAALEAALGFPLFEKRQGGYSLTPSG